MTATKPGRAEPLVLGDAPIGLAFVASGCTACTSNAARLLRRNGAWFIGAGIVHDALLAPVFVLVGFATTRVPHAARTPIRLALAASALLTVFAWPLVQGWGRRAANPSALPLDYGRNLVVSLVAIWFVTAIAVAAEDAQPVTVQLRLGTGQTRTLAIDDWHAPATAVEHELCASLRGPVLDLGCGPGRMVVALAARGVPALGIDASPAAVTTATGAVPPRSATRCTTASRAKAAGGPSCCSTATSASAATPSCFSAASATSWRRRAPR